MGRRKKKKRNINVKKNTIIEVGATVGTMEIQTDTTATRAVFRSNKGEDIKTFTKRMKNTKNVRSRGRREFIDWDSPVIKEFEFFRDDYIIDDGFVVLPNFIKPNIPIALYEERSDILEDWVKERYRLKKGFYQYSRASVYKQILPEFKKWLEKNLDDDLYDQVYPIVLKHLHRRKDDSFDDYLTDTEMELINLQMNSDINIDGMSFGDKNGLWPIENFFGSTSAEINRAVYQRTKAMADIISAYNDGATNKLGNSKANKSLEDFMEEEFEYMRWMIDSISKVIAQLPALHKDTMIFRGGPFDEALEEGEISEFKSPTSFSFKRGIAEDYKGSDWLYIVYAPEGSHLASVNQASRFEGFHYSAGELFNMAHQKYVVLKKDTKNRIVTILLLNDGDRYTTRKG